jgi:hypothetical protein
VVEPLAVLVDTPRTLLHVQKLLKLVSHEAHGYVVSTVGLSELSPRHLVAVAKSGDVVSPPSTSGPMKLLGHVQSLLELSTVQEPKLCHTRFLSQNRMLIVCVPRNQVYTHTIQKMDTE